MAERDTVAPTSGAATPTAIDQAHMVVEATAEAIGENTEDARQGGSIMTQAFSEGETRPQEMHGSVNYQKTTATDGVPKFYDYTSLTNASGKVRG